MIPPVAQISAGGGFSVDIEAMMLSDAAGADAPTADVEQVADVETEVGTEVAEDEAGEVDEGQDADEGSDDAGAPDVDAEDDGEDEDASEDEEGAEDEDEDEAEDSAEPMSKSAKRRAAKRATFEAVKVEAEQARAEVGKTTELLSEAAEVAYQAVEEVRQKDSHIAYLEQKLAELGHVESPEAVRIREMEREQAESANRARFATVRTEAQRAIATRAEVSRIKSEAAIAAVEHGVPAAEITNSLAEVMRNPQSAVASLLGISAQTPVAEIAEKLAAFKAGRTPAKPKADAQAQLTNSKSAPKVRKAARTPAPAKMTTSDADFAAYAKQFGGD